MATIKLYPTADVTLNHSCNTGSSGYTLIDDVTADDNSTYIYLQSGGSGNTSESANATSTFKVSGESPFTNKKVYITGVSYLVRGWRKNNTSAGGVSRIGVSINNGNYSNGSEHSLSYSWNNATGTLSPSGLNTTYNTFADANIRMQVYTTAVGKSNNETRITQAYLTITYLPYYNVSVGGSQGCSSATVNASEAKEGDNVTFTATPNSGYRFVGWYSDSSYTTLVSTSASYTTSITSETALYAKANKIYTITVHGDEHMTASTDLDSGIDGEVAHLVADYRTGIVTFNGWYSDSEKTQRVYPYREWDYTINGSNLEVWVGSTLRFGLYHKIDGQWVLINKVYRKENGVWVVKENPDQIMSTDVKYIDRTSQ